MSLSGPGIGGGEGAQSDRGRLMSNSANNASAPAATRPDSKNPRHDQLVAASRKVLNRLPIAL